MANTPRGATITVVIICAPHITMCSIPMGKPILRAFFSVDLAGRKLPFSTFRLSSLERLSRYHSNIPVTIVSANAVPKAAPSTPKPAPGTKNDMPHKFISREGNIKKKLKMMSRIHITTPIKPLHLSIPPAR